MHHTRLSLLLLLSPLLASACASSSSGAAALGLVEPRITVTQPAGQFEAVVGREIELNLRLSITNGSTEPITLERLQLRTERTSGVEFRPTAREFDERISPGSTEVVDLWVRATIVSPYIARNAPVSVRGTAIFDSPAGRFRTVFTEPVIESDTFEP